MSTRKAASLNLSRRVVLRGAATAGAAGAVVPLAAACGTNGSGGDSAEEADDGGNGDGDDGSDGGSDGKDDSGGKPGEVLASTADVAVGGGVLLKDAGVVVVQPTEGNFKAFSSTCTHKGCDVSKFNAKTITCECHGSQFSTTDGSVQHQPATEPLPEVAINVEGDQITRA